MGSSKPSGGFPNPWKSAASTSKDRANDSSSNKGVAPKASSDNSGKKSMFGNWFGGKNKDTSGGGNKGSADAGKGSGNKGGGTSKPPAGAAPGGADDRGRRNANNNDAKNSRLNPITSKVTGGAGSAQGGHKRTATPDGGYIEDRGNHSVKFRADGTKEFMKSDSKSVQYRKDGSVAQVQRGKSVTTIDKNGTRTVRENGQVKFQQREVDRGGKKVIERNYYASGASQPTTRYYNTYVRSGYTYHAYSPMFSYDPFFYGYLYHPWHPFSYSWGWMYSPWYSPYSYYFAPYPSYYGPSYWLTDYILADVLQSRNRQAAANADAAADRANQAALRAEQDPSNGQNAERQAAAAQMTKEMKDQIKEQVDEAIKAHQGKQSLSLQASLRDRNHIFVVDDDYDVLIEGVDDKTCSLSAGDLVRARENVNDDDQVVKMVVVTAKKESCKAGTRILVSVADLQDMQNAFAEKLEAGMQKMKAEKPDEKAGR